MMMEDVYNNFIIFKQIVKMGGHGPHFVANEKNMQESDEAMRGKIQMAELVKFNPQNFHMEFFDA